MPFLRDSSASRIEVLVNAENNLSIRVPYKNSTGNKWGRFDFTPDSDGVILLKGGEHRQVTEAEKGEKNYDSVTGTWSTSDPNHYAIVAGATMTITFTGSGFVFNSYADTRGGMWRFVIDSTYTVDISVWRAAAVIAEQTVIMGLEEKAHTVVATFLGDDPSHVPSGGAGTGRGWAYYDGNLSRQWKTIAYHGYTDTQLKQSLYPTSNKEFAISCRPSGSEENYKFIPYHTDSVSTITAQSVVIDARTIADWGAEPAYYQYADEVVITQTCKGFHPSDIVNELIQYEIIFTVNTNGVFIRVKIDFISDTQISSGFTIMLPVYTAFGKRMVTNRGIRYWTTATDGSVTYISTPLKGVTFFDPAADYVVTMNYYLYNNVARLGQSGTPELPNTPYYIQHRDANLQKLYTWAWHLTTVSAGASLSYGADIMIGEIPNANSVLPNKGY